MRYVKSFVKWLIISILALVGLAYLFKVDYLFTAVRTIYFNGYKTAFLDDYQYFPTREVENGVGQPWAFSEDYNTVPATERLLETHNALETIAFLVIKNDSIWHEQYFDGYGKDSYTNGFSMAKSIVGAAIGKAVMRSEINSLQDKVIDYLPELKGEFKGDVTIEDVLTMSSGLAWDEAYYSPFSVTTRAYFDSDLRGVMLGLPIANKPGERFIYKSGDTELLTMVLEQATKTNLSSYVSEHFWIPMGAEYPALWQVDREGDGIEKAYCCFTTNARDIARFGKLYKDFGKWEGKQLLDSAYVAKSVQPHFNDSPEYGYSWWLAKHKGKDFFYMRGHLGQFVIVSPKDNVIIVRLGHVKGRETDEHPHSEDLYVYIEEAYAMLNSEKTKKK